MPRAAIAAQDVRAHRVPAHLEVVLAHEVRARLDERQVDLVRDAREREVAAARAHERAHVELTDVERLLFSVFAERPSPGSVTA